MILMKRMINKLPYILLFVFLMACGNHDTKTNTETTTTPPSNEPAAMPFTITNQFPHDTSTYTEGLEFYDHNLYESGGQYGNSKLVSVDLNTGKDIKKIPLEKKYFGEGITILNNKIYQMTWKEKTCFVYDAKTFAKLKTFSYDGEGWGMTNNGKQIIMSDGSNNLTFRDPETFKVLSIVGVTDNNGPVANINELEYINGYILANVWQTDVIIKIDPESGRVLGKADFSGTKEKYFPEALDKAEVLNGIAYDSTTKRLFITGKYWPKIFEVKGLTN
jgi:glutamine cyclotransferase